MTTTTLIFRRPEPFKCIAKFVGRRALRRRVRKHERKLRTEAIERLIANEISEIVAEQLSDEPQKPCD